MRQPHQSLLVMLLIIPLMSCGGGDGGDGKKIPDILNSPNTPSTLKGTVAAEDPVEANITIVDSTGKTFSTTSDSEGKYAIDMLSAVGPYILKAEPQDSTQAALYSYSTGPGIANATPFTTLGLFITKYIDPQETFDNWNAADSRWSLDDVTKAMATINANLKSALENNNIDPNTYDMFTAEFNSNEAGINALLNDYTVEIDYSSNDFVVSDFTGSNIQFDETIDTSNYYIGAWFALEQNTDWVVTFTYTINEQSAQFLENFPIDSESVPLSRAAFIEDQWDDVGQSINESINTTQGTITYSTTQFTPEYTVEGDGGVGTVITTSLSYGYHIFGNVSGQPIDQTYSFNWTNIYTRVK